MSTTTQTQVRTVDVQAKEWFDRVNGNSYFSVQVTVNYGTEDAKTIYIPFQGGYGDHYKYMAFNALQENGIIPKQDSFKAPWRYYDENKIIARQSLQVNCLKRDVIAWGAK